MECAGLPQNKKIIFVLFCGIMIFLKYDFKKKCRSYFNLKDVFNRKQFMRERERKEKEKGATYLCQTVEHKG